MFWKSLVECFARTMALLTELGNSFALVLQRCRPNGAERQSAGNFFSSASRWVKVSPDTAGLRPSSTSLTDGFSRDSWGRSPSRFLESRPEVSATLEKMAALSRDATTERKFEDVVKSAEQAAVLVLVY